MDRFPKVYVWDSAQLPSLDHAPLIALFAGNCQGCSLAVITKKTVRNVLSSAGGDCIFGVLTA